ncbi:MAG: T9SS type A sorting domain-containing protein [Bacteroidetes bacterium]|nr:T9SS type A sorting domain-containing protein [Bacteroidota bacterium]
MKKFTILFLSFILMYQLGSSQNGLEGIIVEKYYVSNAADAAGSSGVLPSGSTTYRIFIDLLPGYTFQAAYGVANHELRFQTTTSFFNNEDYGATTPTFSKTNARNNTVMLDSWLSGGASCGSNYGILKTEDGVAGGTNVINANGILANNDPIAGIPLTTQDGIYAGTTPSVTVLGFTPSELNVIDATSNVGNLISTYNASWAVLGGSTGPIPSVNKILIAQFTTNGTFSFKLNIQIGTPTPGVSQNFVAENATGSEILFPALIYPAPANPTAQVSIASNATFPVCDGTSVTFTANPVNGGATPTYQWKKNNANVGTNSATYTLSGLKNNDQVKCVMTSSIVGALNNPATSNTIVAQIIAKPIGDIISTGPLTFCSGANACTLSTTSNFGETYVWYKGAAAIANSNSPTYVPTSTNTYKVKVTNTGGCSKTSSTKSITVNALPASSVSVTGPTTFCKGSNACTLTANSGAGYTYQWKKGSNNVAGATGITYQPNATSTAYKVVVTNANGCSKTSSSVAITANSLPTATVTPQGPTTFCSGDSVVLKANSGAGLTYQWIKGVNPIAGQTSINYSAKTQASYKVTVTNANGCTKNSSAVSTTVNCREGDAFGISERNESLSTFPNPTTGPCTINYYNNDLISTDAQLVVVDVLGRVIYTEEIEIADGVFNKELSLVSPLMKGMYFVSINYSGKSITNKFLVD